MKAIQTKYKGYHFRSRLEARWAVFFDALGLKWEYEPEGFDLGGGVRYLPDFWLPDLDMWVEVKAGQPTITEAQKAKALTVQSNKAVFITCGSPSDTGRLVIERGVEDEIHEFIAKFVSGCELVVRKFEDDYDLAGLDDEPLGKFIDKNYCFHTMAKIIWWPSNDWDSYAVNCTVLNAQSAARSARFEFGECGATA